MKEESLVDFAIGFIALVPDADGSLKTLSSALGVTFIVAAVMLSIRRWHNINHSGEDPLRQ